MAFFQQFGTYLLWLITDLTYVLCCLVPLVPPVGGLASATRSGGFPFVTVSYRWLLDRVSSQLLLNIVALNRVLVKTVGLCFWSGDSSILGAPTSVVTCMCHF